MLPVPIRLVLPGPAWRAVAPASIERPDVLFAAVRDGTDLDVSVTGSAGGSATLTVDGDGHAGAGSVVRHADAALRRLRPGAVSVRLTHRRVVGSARVPGVSQLVHTVVDSSAGRTEVTRMQALLCLVDRDDPGLRAVLLAECVCAPSSADVVGPEFARFVAGLRVDDGA